MVEKATIETDEVLAGLLNHTYMTRLLPIPRSGISSPLLTMAVPEIFVFTSPEQKNTYYKIRYQLSLTNCKVQK